MGKGGNITMSANGKRSPKAASIRLQFSLGEGLDVGCDIG